MNQQDSGGKEPRDYAGSGAQNCTSHPQTNEQLFPFIRDEEAEEANRLYESVFGEKRSLETWRWKFRENPFWKHARWHVAKHDGKIIAAYPLVAVKFKVNDGEAFAGLAVETAVAPEWRGIAIFGILQGLVEVGIRENPREGRLFCFGFPTREHYKIGKRLLGYDDVGAVTVMRKRLSLAGRVAKLTRSRTLVRLARMASNPLWWMRQGSPKKGKSKIEIIETFDARFDEFWERAKDVVAPILVCRDRQYLRWRYEERPDVSYTTLACTESGRLEGFIVLRINPGLVRKAFIADFLCLEEEKATQLISASLEFLRASGADILTGWCVKHHFLYRVLKKAGFEELEHSRALVLKTDETVQAKDFLTDFANWYVTLGDSDGV